MPSWATISKDAPSASSVSEMSGAASPCFAGGLFGMQVIACDPYLDEKTIAARGAVKVSLDELLQRSRFRIDQLPAR